MVVRWLAEPRKLSREQFRAIREAERRGEAVALSAISLIEIATLRSERRVQGSLDHIFTQIEMNPLFRVLPITIPIALEAGALSVLRDPADRTIVATARVHRLRLLTSDQRIVDSKLVPTID